MSMQSESTCETFDFSYPSESPINHIKAVLQAEVQALQSLIQNIPSTTQPLINELISTTGSVIFSGAGKSGHVSRKISATFASLGISSFFLHPHDALHGDLGTVKPNDLVILLSKSGTGSELELITLLLNQRAVKTVLLCCSPGTLGKMVHLMVQLPLEREACLLNLAPTSSSTLMAAFGDALAVATSSYKGFSWQDFARNHPSGALGKSLLLNVASLMHQGSSLPLLNLNASFEEVLAVMMEKKLGVGIVVNEENTLLGMITDGDMRRACTKGPSIFSSTAEELMTHSPKSIHSSIRASHALALMEDHSITSLIVTNSTNQVSGLLHIHSLLKAGIRKDL